MINKTITKINLELNSKTQESKLCPHSIMDNNNPFIQAFIFFFGISILFWPFVAIYCLCKSFWGTVGCGAYLIIYICMRYRYFPDKHSDSGSGGAGSYSSDGGF